MRLLIINADVNSIPASHKLKLENMRLSILPAQPVKANVGWPESSPCINTRSNEITFHSIIINYNSVETKYKKIKVRHTLDINA